MVEEALNGFGIVENGQTQAKISTMAPVRATEVKEAVLGHQNGPGTRADGFSPPVGSLGSSFNQEISQGDV